MFKLKAIFNVIRSVFVYTDRKKLVLNILVLIFAFVGGTAATLSAMNAMISSEFSPPCYASLFTGGNGGSVAEDINAGVVDSTSLNATMASVVMS